METQDQRSKLELLAENEVLKARIRELEAAANVAMPGDGEDDRWFIELNPQIPWTASANGEILDFNPRWLDLTGLSRIQALGEGWSQVQHPDDLPAMAKLWRLSIETGAQYDVEHRVRMVDGSFRWMRSRAFPRRDDRGQILRWYGSTEDIHERREAHNELARTALIYQAIGETIPFGIWICEPNGRNTYASEALLRLTGMTQEECSDYGWGRALHPDDNERVMAAWHECVKVRGEWNQEFRYIGTDGQAYPVLVQGLPVIDDSGEIICWAGVNLDIRRVKEGEALLRRQTEELKVANAQLEQFSYGAAHDLQEPLRTIRVFTDLLLHQRADRSPEALAEYSGYIQKAAARMQLMIRSLLGFSMVRREAIQLVAVSAEEALNEAIQVCQVRIEESGAEIRASSLPEVLGDALLLSLLFQNLISNAIKYSKKGVAPRIEICATAEGADWLFVVRDEGIGFADEYQERIFVPFFRLHARTEYDGTGLGLASCRRIVERFGGKIWAESKPDEGSSFYFTLKRAESLEKPPEAR